MKKTATHSPLRCAECDYSLQGIDPDAYCPECGWPVKLSARRIAAPPPRWFSLYEMYHTTLSLLAWVLTVFLKPAGPTRADWLWNFYFIFEKRMFWIQAACFLIGCGVLISFTRARRSRITWLAILSSAAYVALRLPRMF